MSSKAGSDVIFAQQGSLGRITLNRPKVINALTHSMINAIDLALQDWQEDAAIKTVLIEGAGERGFCAGGDIRVLYESAKTGDFAPADAFFRDEYRLNARIAAFPKPLFAFMDGIVMGGGVGLSAHASHRLVTPRGTLAMPEVGIGFIPDVGGTYLLARAPGFLGIHAALTAARLMAADALLCGLADVCVPAESLSEIATSLAAGLEDTDSIQLHLHAHARAAPQGALEASRHWIDSVYVHPTVEKILSAMALRDEPDAKTVLDEISCKSPTSLKVTLRLLQEARGAKDLGSCLQREYNAALTCIRGHDFVEGVRAAVVDKDRKPRWSPAALADVTPESVEAYFKISQDTTLF